MRCLPILVAALSAFALRAVPAAAEPPGEVAESALYPIRIFHDSDIAGWTGEFIEAAEAAWEHLVLDLGMTAPLTMFGDDPGEGFDVVFDTDLPGAATYEILGGNPQTPVTDCAVLAYLNPLAMAVEGMIDMTVHHLMARNALRAVDCIEPLRPAYETFATALGVHYMGAAEHPYWLSYQLPGFQKQPWRSLDWGGFTSAEAIWYGYGTALFALFVDERWGDGDGGVLPAIWALTAQEGNIVATSGPTALADVDNYPHYFDAFAMFFESEGTTFDEAFVHFVEWRFFVGADADGAHSEAAAGWTGGEVSREAVLTAADLPVVDRECVHPLSAYGAGYIDIDPAGIDEPLQIGFAGNPESAWWAGLFLVPSGLPAAVEPLLLEDGAGSVEIPQPGDYRKIVLAVANLGDGDHDPNLQDWSSADGDYTYTVAGPGSGDGDADGDADTDDDAGDGAAASADGSGCGCEAPGRAAGPSLPGALLALFWR